MAEQVGFLQEDHEGHLIRKALKSGQGFQKDGLGVGVSDRPEVPPPASLLWGPSLLPWKPFLRPWCPSSHAWRCGTVSWETAWKPREVRATFSRSVNPTHTKIEETAPHRPFQHMQHDFHGSQRILGGASG